MEQRIESPHRSKFSGKIGFVLAAAGSAVGLGNIWRFPYLAAKYGGGVFLLVYLILVLTFGFSVMVGEIAIGRKTGKSPIGAFAALNKKYKFVGFIASLIAFLILPYYSVIGGWVAKYFAVFLTGGGSNAATDEFFGGFISKPLEPIMWQSLFVIAAFIVVVRGVKKGIESASKVLMPILIALCIILSIYSITLPGAWEGVKYYILPDFSHFSSKTVLAALGQMFYSLSLAMGIMITYGSYLRREDNLEQSVKQIAIFDAGIAFLAGLMIVPAVFAFNRDALGAGPGLMFITLPKVFANTGAANIIGTIFFLLVIFAALTSAISLMEAVVSTVCDQFKLKRTSASIIVASLAILLGIPSSLGYGPWDSVRILGMEILDFFDFITNSVLMPITALLTCIFIGYVVGTDVIAKEVKQSGEFKWEKLFTVVIKYFAPIFIIVILFTSVLSAFGVINI